MKIKHTPGPWDARELFDDGDDAQSLGLFIYKNHDATAHRNPLASLPGIGREDFANAQLIAAAPDLLAACEAALLRDDIASDELGELIRNAVNQAKGNQS